MGQELFGGGIHLDADGIDTGENGIVEGAPEMGLIDIVLILTDTDGFGVEFDEFGEWIHQAATDGDGTADGDILIREFLACDFGSGVDGRAGFVDGNDRRTGGQSEG